MYFVGAFDIAYVDLGKERRLDERKDEKIFIRDIVEPIDSETSESGEKTRVSVENMSSDRAIDVV
jgi:hypothetical protein